MALNDAANILAGFITGSKESAARVLSDAGYSDKQITAVKSGYFIGEPDNKNT